VAKGENGRRNYKNHLKGKEKLKFAVLPHPTGDSVFDFIKSSLKKVESFNEWQETNYRK